MLNTLQYWFSNLSSDKHYKKAKKHHLKQLNQTFHRANVDSVNLAFIQLNDVPPKEKKKVLLFPDSIYTPDKPLGIVAGIKGDYIIGKIQHRRPMFRPMPFMMSVKDSLILVFMFDLTEQYYSSEYVKTNYSFSKFYRLFVLDLSWNVIGDYVQGCCPSIDLECNPFSFNLYRPISNQKWNRTKGTSKKYR